MDPLDLLLLAAETEMPPSWKGVYKTPGNRFRCQFCHQGHIHQVGIFKTAEEAARAWDAAAVHLRNEDTHLNFPGEPLATLPADFLERVRSRKPRGPAKPGRAPRAPWQRPPSYYKPKSVKNVSHTTSEDEGATQGAGRTKYQYKRHRESSESPERDEGTLDADQEAEAVQRRSQRARKPSRVLCTAADAEAWEAGYISDGGPGLQPQPSASDYLAHPRDSHSAEHARASSAAAADFDPDEYEPDSPSEETRSSGSAVETECSMPLQSKRHTSSATHHAAHGSGAPPHAAGGHRSKKRGQSSDPVPLSPHLPYDDQTLAAENGGGDASRQRRVARSVSHLPPQPPRYSESERAAQGGQALGKAKGQLLQSSGGVDVNENTPVTATDAGAQLPVKEMMAQLAPEHGAALRAHFAATLAHAQQDLDGAEALVAWVGDMQAKYAQLASYAAVTRTNAAHRVTHAASAAAAAGDPALIAVAAGAPGTPDEGALTTSMT